MRIWTWDGKKEQLLRAPAFVAVMWFVTCECCGRCGEEEQTFLQVDRLSCFM